MATAAPSVSVAIVRDPALVRTVRLVAASVARRTAQDEDFVEEVRLAVGEACALLVGTGHSGRVSVRLTIDDRLEVVVEAEGEVLTEDDEFGDVDGIEPWALLAGLIEDFAVEQDAGRTSLRMSWPLS